MGDIKCKSDRWCWYDGGDDYSKGGIADDDYDLCSLQRSPAPPQIKRVAS